MQFLSRDGSKSYHLFIKANTMCKMWRSGGINTMRKGWKLYFEPIQNKQLCTMCENVRKTHENTQTDLHG